MDFSKLSREDWMVGGGGILLILSLLIFGWYSYPSVTVDGTTLGGGSIAATSAPYAIWGILALIVTIAVVVDLSLARFSPATVIPTTNLGRDMTRTAAAGVVALGASHQVLRPRRQLWLRVRARRGADDHRGGRRLAERPGHLHADRQGAFAVSGTRGGGRRDRRGR